MIRYIYVVLAFFMVLGSLPAQAQKKKSKVEKVTTTLRLVNEEGEGIPNAHITVGEGLLETVSDQDGNFTLKTDANSVLLVKASGYKIQWIDLSKGLPGTELVMTKDLLYSAASDVIHLPLNLQTDQRSLVGAVSKVSGEALKTYPDLTLTNTLQGRLMGLTVRQTANGLGNNTPSLYLRGLSRGGSDGIITIVDGIERSVDYLIAEEIESIEVLKDATAKILYGPRAANGVLLVTTKRGRANTRVLNASVSYGASFATRMPEYLNSFEYATLYNEARANDGMSPFYSPSDLEGYRNSSGPNDQRYPNVDYYDEFLNTSAPYRKAALEYSGGDENNQYALVLGYVGADGLEKKGPTPTLNRFNLRANLDFKINERLTAKVGASGVVEKRAWGTVTHGGTFSALSNHRPNEYPFLLTDPILRGITAEGEEGAVPPLGGSFNQSSNLYGSFVYGGFTEFQSFYGQTNVGIDYNLDNFVKGLSVNGFYTIDNYQYFESGKTEVPVSYAQRWFLGSKGQDTVAYTPLRKRTIEDNQSRKNQNYYNTSGWTAGLAFNRDFGSHSVDATLTHFYFTQDHDNWVQDLRFSNTVFRIKHGFNNKFYTNVTLAYMGSDKMPEKNRYKLFPAVGAAWVLSEESFLKDNALFDFLKVKGSFGILGYDRANSYYMYENRWNTDGSVNFEEQNNTSITQTNLQQVGNPDLDWEKSREVNIGIEGMALNNRLQFEFNYFHEYRYDILQSPSYRYPVSAGGLFSQQNQGENQNQGIEGSLAWTNAVGDLNYSFGGNFIFSKDKVVKMNEVTYPAELDYYRQTGKPSDVIFGYEADGLFTSQEQIDNHPFQTFGPYGLGSVRYKDQNGDNVIDNLDRKVIGNSFPRTTLGLNLDLNYKGFGLFVLGTAELGIDNVLNNSYYRNYAEGKYSTLAAERWHATNNPGGKYPALTTTNGTNDYVTSTFWMENASFFRLKNVELSYTLSGTSFAKAYKFYVRGTNLLVASTNQDLDPEVLSAGVSNYPVFRTITGGLSVSF